MNQTAITMKKLTFILLFPLIAFFCSPTFIQAQDTPTQHFSTTPDYAKNSTALQSSAAIQNTIGIGPRLGYYKSGDADEGNFYGGLQIRARIGPVFGLEAAAEYHTQQAFGIGDFEADTRLIPITGSVLLFIPMGEHLAPYGIAGLGAYYTIYDYPDNALEELGLDDFEEFNMGYHLGFGIELPMSSHVALNVDYRYIFLNPDENEESLDDASFSGNSFTAGLMFYF